MAPSRIDPEHGSPVTEERLSSKVSVQVQPQDAVQLLSALEAARARFAAKNPKSFRLHDEATKSLPGGNTRTLLYTAPFPIFLSSGSGYHVTSEDGHM